MDEEVAAITSDSPVTTSPATESPELNVPTAEAEEATEGELCEGETANSQVDEDNVQADQPDQPDFFNVTEERKEEEAIEHIEEEDEEKNEDDDNDVDDEKDDENDSEEEEEEGLEGGLCGGLNEEQICHACNEKYKQPRVLSCLHVFCTPCLEKGLDDGDGDHDSISEGVGLQKDCIKCTQCKQVTSLDAKGVEDLPLDTVMANILDMAAMNDPQIVCTSCKAREKAVARCNDCASFLCPNCVTAHQYMRCFENHKVVSFEDLQNGEGVDMAKPMFCTIHTTENLKYFCNTCRELVCNECVVVKHKQPVHTYERISELEDIQKAELKALISECKGKVQFCEEATSTLENALSEVQMQRDNARGQIEETFQTYRTMLEARKDALMKELDDMHSTQELEVMEMFHNVEKTIEKIEDGTGFAERILEHGSGAELLSMKKMIKMQLMSLINNTPKPDVNIKINFHTDQDRFEEAITETFGSFLKVKDEDQKNTSTSSLQSLEVESLAVGKGRLMTDGAISIPSATAASFIPGIQALPPLSTILL